MDASKAFHRVNHWTLFKKLIDRGMPDVFVRLLVYWYRMQNTCVRWGTACSEMFTVSNWVGQGGILSPLFFSMYMDGLSEILCRTECGCTMGGRMINHLMYADDLVAKGLQRLVEICAAYGDIHDIKFNHTKTVCMYLPSKGNCTTYFFEPAKIVCCSEVQILRLIYNTGQL